MVHARKGCLERPEQDLACDGSRIEGSHKSWNSIMRSFPSGIAVFTALGHDHVHRRNIRLANNLRHPNSDHALRTRDFARSTHGSHHIHLTIAISTLWNSLLSSAGSSTLRSRPLPQISAHEEHFGLVVSDHNSTFGGLLEIKDEPEDEGERLLVAAAAQNEASDSPLDPGTGTISYLNIPPSHLSCPMPQPPTARPVTFPSVSSTAPIETNTLDNPRPQTAGTSMNRSGATSSIDTAWSGASAISEAHASSLRDGATSLRVDATSIKTIGPSGARATAASASATVPANATGTAHAAGASTTSISLATDLGASVTGARTSSEAHSALTGASAVSKGPATKASTATGIEECAVGTNPSLSNSGTTDDASAAAGTSANIIVGHHSRPVALCHT